MSVLHPYCFEINKEIEFSSAHYIPHPDAGKCQRLHGHNYAVNVTVAGDKLNDAGFLVNFQTLKKLVRGRFDHVLLNALEEFSDTDPSRFPTAEGISFVIWEVIEGYLKDLPHEPHCVQVQVRETPGNYAVYRPKIRESL